MRRQCPPAGVAASPPSLPSLHQAGRAQTNHLSRCPASPRIPRRTMAGPRCPDPPVLPLTAPSSPYWSHPSGTCSRSCGARRNPPAASEDWSSGWLGRNRAGAGTADLVRAAGELGECSTFAPPPHPTRNPRPGGEGVLLPRAWPCAAATLQRRRTPRCSGASRSRGT